MTPRAHAKDLFELFPDLPYMRHRTPEEQVARLRAQVNATRARAMRNIARQREAAARVRAAISARRRR
ncbi:MAG TPA: hypothetical protein VKE96_11320 [Vicinamibacterales bacterium]|nr:hypothetical protein [Vicinamibacterales bacterium]